MDKSQPKNLQLRKLVFCSSFAFRPVPHNCSSLNVPSYSCFAWNHSVVKKLKFFWRPQWTPWGVTVVSCKCVNFSLSTSTTHLHCLCYIFFLFGHALILVVHMPPLSFITVQQQRMFQSLIVLWTNTTLILNNAALRDKSCLPCKCWLIHLPTVQIKKWHFSIFFVFFHCFRFGSFNKCWKSFKWNKFYHQAQPYTDGPWPSHISKDVTLKTVLQIKSSCSMF